MKIVAVTTQNKRYYDKLGKQSIDSFVKFQPKDISLIVYTEDFVMSDHDNVKYRPFSLLDADFHKFMVSEYKQRIKIFAMKAFSWLHTCEIEQADRIIWVDSDVITYNPIPKQFLVDLCDEKTLATYMAVIYDHKKTKQGIVKIDPVLCGETGFYVINKNHRKFHAFIQRYREYYNLGLDDNLRRFYDGDVFGAVVSEFEKHNVLFRDLGDRKHNTIFKYTILKDYMTHYKGKVKKSDDFEAKQ